MKSVYSVLFCLFLIIALKFVDSKQVNESENQKSIEEINEQLAQSIEARNKLLNLLLADIDASNDEVNSTEQDEEESPSGLDKRMTYRYGKRMTYRYGKRSAMPYRFGKRANGHDQVYPSAQRLIEYLDNGDNSEAKSKRMTYRMGRK